MSNNPDLMRLSTALLMSVLLHAGLAMLTGYAPITPRGAGTPAPPARPLTARLVPSTQVMPAPGATALAPARSSRPQATSSEPSHSDPVRAAPHTRPPHPLGPIDLNIPEARLPTVHGTLILKLWINDQGRVVAYEPEPTDLPEEYVSAVGDTLTTVHFAPALQDGRPVAAIYRIEIDAEAAEPKP